MGINENSIVPFMVYIVKPEKSNGKYFAPRLQSIEVVSVSDDGTWRVSAGSDHIPASKQHEYSVDPKTAWERAHKRFSGKLAAQEKVLDDMRGVLSLMKAEGRNA